MANAAVGADGHPGSTAVAAYPEEYASTVLLHDGTTVDLRPIRPSDEAALASFHEHLSSETVYRRYFTAHPHLRHWELEEFTRVDHVDRFALVAVRDGDLVALASFDRSPGAEAAELAFVVTDRLQGLGLGTLLLEHLAHAAWRLGVARFTAMTLGDNLAMQAVFTWAGFACTRSLDHGIMDLSFDIAPSQSYLERITERAVEAMAARVRRRRPTGAAGDGTGVVGVAWQSPRDAWELRTALRSSGTPVRRAVGGDARAEVAELLAYLDQEPGIDVICCQADQIARPRTLVAVARLVAARRPLVAICTGATTTELWRQAGAVTVTDPGQAALVAGTLAPQVRAGTWTPPGRGSIPDRAAPPARLVPPTASPGHPDDQGLLDAGRTEALLRARHLPTRPLARGDALPGARLVVGRSAQAGLSARIVCGRGAAVVRVLPLTDVDAAEVAGSCLPPGLPADRVAALVTRAAELVEDVPVIERLELPLGGRWCGAEAPPRIYTGPRRPPDDDPYLRRAAAHAGDLRFELPPATERRTPP